MALDNPGLILWLDIETTGLSPEKDHILELAVVLTDWSLVPKIAEHRASWLIRPYYRLESVHPHCIRMHGTNGLLAETVEKGMTKEAVKDDFIAWMARHIPQKSDCDTVLAGRSVHFDRQFVERHFGNKVFFRLSHRHLDVSAIHAFLTACGVSPPSIRESDHRAASDIAGDIDTLSYYAGTMQDLLRRTIPDLGYIPVAAREEFPPKP